uniref:Uncharacterized protein n=1 Tax=Ciona savignyi TaxID=51511 RepID=H2YDI4_CIOSA
MDSKVCAGNVKIGESSAEQDLNSDVQHWPSELMETTTLPCHRLPLFSPITGALSEAETSLSEPRQTDLRNSIHGGVVVVTRSSSTVSAHLKTNQPDESVQLTVPILREYFEDLETGQSQFSGEGNVFTPRYSCSLDEDSDMVSRSSSRTVKLSGSENV